jgi:SAM-dependent methyltransferase
MGRRLGPEASRLFDVRERDGFNAAYLSGDAVLDVGYRGADAAAEPVTAKAIGVDLDYPGYDGIHLPFPDRSQDAVFACHCLEHIDNFRAALAEWYRVLKVGGHLVVCVPHQYLYERKAAPPSRFNADHKRFYTPASLLAEIEASLPLDGYRVRSLKDRDDGFDYSVPPHSHAVGAYEIELVLQKIARPSYGPAILHGHHAARYEAAEAEFCAAVLADMLAADAAGRDDDVRHLGTLLGRARLPPFARLKPRLAAALAPGGVEAALPALARLLRPFIAREPFDAAYYLAQYADVSAAAGARGPGFAREHYLQYGYFEGRAPAAAPPPGLVGSDPAP